MKDVLKAIKIDNELAEKQVTEKKAKTVTSGNIEEEDNVEHLPLQPNENQAFPPLYHYGNEHYPVTNGTISAAHGNRKKRFIQLRAVTPPSHRL